MTRSTQPPGSEQPPRPQENELRNALADLADETATMKHPDLEELIAFHEGWLDDDGRSQEVEEHLAGCMECNSTLLDLNVFSNDVEGGPDTRDDLADALAWRTMRDQLLESKRETETGLAVEAEEPAPPRRSSPIDFESDKPPQSRWLMALAAALLLATVGLGIYASLERQRSADLAEQVAILTAPQHDVPILYLDTATRSLTIDRPSIAITEGQRWVVIVSPPSERERWDAVLYDESGATAWSAQNIGVSSLGTVRLSFSQRALPTGPYRLELSPVDGTDGETVHRYDFVVRIDPASRR